MNQESEIKNGGWGGAPQRPPRNIVRVRAAQLKYRGLKSVQLEQLGRFCIQLWKTRRPSGRPTDQTSVSVSLFFFFFHGKPEK